MCKNVAPKFVVQVERLYTSGSYSVSDTRFALIKAFRGVRIRAPRKINVSDYLSAFQFMLFSH